VIPSTDFYALIMAGGGGTRLWPLSRGQRPKQLLPLIEDRSMFRVSIDRLAPLFPPERVYVVCGSKHAAELRAQAPDIPAENFVVEPYGRDNGPAAALGIATIQRRNPAATVAYLPSDHHITDTERFRQALAAAYTVAQRGIICTLGITPSLPATGFGYIQRGNLLAEIAGFNVYTATRFHEKPDYATAVQFLTSGTFSWNAGMFIMRADTAVSEFSRQQPAIGAALADLIPLVDTPAYADALPALWERMTKISIDHAIMEGAVGMAVIPVEMGWSDVGSWDALYDVLPHDATGNSARGAAAAQHLLIDAYNSLIVSDKLTVAIGVDDLVIVDTEDVLMVCHKDKTQSVRDAVTRLKGSHDGLL